MADAATTANVFWSEFDNAFKYNPTAEIQTLFLSIFSAPGQPFSFSRILNLWKSHRVAGTYPAGFVNDITPLTTPITRLAELQTDIFTTHFSSDVALERAVFELFGQGVLFDDRRPIGDKIHQMDTGGPANPPIGYHRWHVFARAAQLLGIDATRWLRINREIALAWAIQSELKPVTDSQTNPPMSAVRLVLLRSFWMAQTADKLDSAFDAFPYPTVARADSQVEQIKELLETLVGAQQISAHGNFWRSFVTGDDFSNYNVFGDPQLPLLIRGNANASNLVKALEGTPPFDDTDFPRMPVPGVARRYATPTEISLVRNWIDAGCP